MTKAHSKQTNIESICDISLIAIGLKALFRSSRSNTNAFSIFEKIICLVTLRLSQLT